MYSSDHLDGPVNGKRRVCPQSLRLKGKAGISRRLKTVLEILLSARDYALEAGAAPWDFAEEIADLRAAGVTNVELRCLLAKGLLVHAEETSPPEASRREFREIGRLSLSDRTCFVLTAEGELFARAVVSTLAGSSPPEAGGDLLHELSGNHIRTPQWLSDRRELWVGNVVVKRFRRPAPNQETVLAAFQEEGWPVRIDDPLTRQPDRDAIQCLHDTINHLNRNRSSPLIHFAGDGTGRGIRWRFTDAPAIK
jgi:hypothetical protein